VILLPLSAIETPIDLNVKWVRLGSPPGSESPQHSGRASGRRDVIDEIQRYPGLFPVLRVLVDRPKSTAKFLVLGSASPDLLRQGAETLAGRIAYHSPRLTPSMRNALSDLKLQRLDVIHAGERTFVMERRVRAVALSRLLDDLQPLS